MMGNLKNSLTFLDSQLGIYRFLLLIGGISSPFLHDLAPEGLVDPLWSRIVLSIYYFSIFFGSFLIPKVKTNIYGWTASTLFLLSAYIQLMMYLNAVHPYYVVCHFVILAAAPLMAESRKFVVLFSLFNAPGLILTAIFVAAPLFPVSIVLVLSMVILSFGVVGIEMRINPLLRKIEDHEESTLIHQTAVGASRDGVLLVNDSGDLQQCNRTFLKLWNLESTAIKENRKEEVLKRMLDQLKEPDRFVAFTNSPQAADINENLEEYEMKNGIFLEIHFISVRVKGRVVGRLWFFRNITERKRMENLLIASEKRLRSRNDRLTQLASHPALLTGNLNEAYEVISKTAVEVLKSDNASIWFFDDKGDEIQCEKLYRGATDTYEKGVVIQVRNYEDYFKEVSERRIFTVNRTINHPLVKEFYEGPSTGRAGALIHARIRAEGKVIGIFSIEQADFRNWSVDDQSFVGSMADLLAISVEVARRKAVQEELERSLVVMKATFDLSETGILVVDNNNDVIDYNELYLKTWNMDPVFIIEENYENKLAYCLSQLKDSRSVEEGVKLLWDRPGMEFAGVIEFLDGRVVERYSKALSVNGEIVGRVWFYLDITERKIREAELVNRNFELDSFVYRASHDLKAPLNSIMGLITLIRDEKEISAILQYVGMMDKSVKKLDSFIRQLTQFSQDARLQVVQKPIVFQEVIEEAWEGLRHMENAERVRLDMEINQTGEFLNDPVRLGIAFNNMISNAIKYQDLAKENPFLKINIDIQDGQAFCRFEDNGVGIEQDHLDKVFDLFFRASVQATGSGLGLYITCNAIEKLGGKIEVHSEVGAGTVFSMSIPNRNSNPVEYSEELQS